MENILYNLDNIKYNDTISLSIFTITVIDLILLNNINISIDF